MLIYLAATTLHYIEDIFDYKLLMSYYYITPKIAVRIPQYQAFMLDSGIFTYLNNPERAQDVDWYEYATAYGNFVKEHKIEHYIEIDVDKFIGLAEVERLRAHLEKIVGWKCMPVWHMNRGWDKWVEICKDYPYICFGAFITDNLKAAKYRYIPAFLREAAKHGAKVHGLGFTQLDGIRKYKFHSVDSSSWNGGARYGSRFTFENGEIRSFKRPAGSRVVKMREIVRHNLKEWIKFSDYAEANY